MQLQIARRIGRRVHRSRNVWRIIGECNCWLLIARRFGRRVQRNVWRTTADWQTHWQESLKVAERTAMCGIVLGKTTADWQTHWQESSKVAERTAMCGIVLGNVTADCWTHWQESSEVGDRKQIAAYYFGKCNCRLRDALAGECRGHGMYGVVLGNATAVS